MVYLISQIVFWFNYYTRKVMYTENYFFLV